MMSYRELCAKQVKWYVENGKFPHERICKDSDGVRFVIGDWSWQRREQDKCSTCGQAIPANEIIDHLLPS